MSQPIILLGAARSGTKMLRGLIASGNGLSMVPYDVNFIWRYGNENVPHDALDESLATESVCRFIRTKLPQIAGAKESSSTVVEKTVSNMLRIPFVLKVMPDARFVTVVRDGRDVIESAHRCWVEPPDFSYIWKKLKSYPLASCPGYAWNYGFSALRRMFGQKKSPPIWGPKYPGIENDMATMALVEVCALQWTRCMEFYERDRSLIPSDQLCEIRYESLVRDPAREIERFAQFARINPQPLLEYAKKEIRTSNVGKHKALRDDLKQAVNTIAGPMLVRWGYGGNETAQEAA